MKNLLRKRFTLFVALVLLVTSIQLPSPAKAQESYGTESEIELFAAKRQALQLNKTVSVKAGKDIAKTYEVSFTAKEAGEYYFVNASDSCELSFMVYDSKDAFLAGRWCLPKNNACPVTLKKGQTVYAKVTLSEVSQEDYAAGNVVFSVRVEKKAWKYSLNKNGVLTIGGSGALYVDSDFFMDWSRKKGIEIKEIVIGNNITGICRYAFYYTPDLEKVTIGKNVKFISDYAFGSCPKLASVKIGSGLEELAGNAFYECPKLATLSVNSKNKVLKNYKGVLYSADYKTLLLYPGSLKEKEFIVPSKVTTIAPSAFVDNKYLETITIGKNVEKIDEEPSKMFMELKNLKKIKINSANKNFSVKDDVVYSKDGKTLYYYANYKKDSSFTVGSGVTTIAYSAFTNRYLTKLTIPSSVKTMEEGAVYECSNLKEVKIFEGLKSIKEYCFTFCPNIQTVYLPKTLQSIGFGAFCGSGELKNVYFSGTKAQWDAMEKEYCFDCREDMPNRFGVALKK